MLINMNIGGTERSLLNLLYTLDPEEYDVTLLLFENKGGYMEGIPSWVHVRTLEGYQAMKPEIMEPPLAVAVRHFKNGKPGRAAGIALRHLIYKLMGSRTAYYRYVMSSTKDSSEKYDTAVAYVGPMDFISLFILEHVKAKKKIQWIHFDVSRIYFDTEYAKRHYPGFDRIYTVSEAVQKQLLQALPEIAGITEIRHNIVSKEQCLKEAERGHGFTDNFDGTRILTVGRLSKEKGQEIIPSIASELKKRGYHFRWYLIGGGKTEHVIIDKITEYKLENDVILLGTIKNPYPYYAQCNIYVQTSLYEGYSMSLLEAQLFNKPIISTNVAGAEDILNKSPQETIVNNEKELVKAIENRLIEMTEIN